MCRKTVVSSARPFLSAILAAGTLIAGSGEAKDSAVTVSIQVSTRGLDVEQPRGAQELYRRLQHAAHDVCSHGMRVDLAPPANPDTCYETALGNSIRSADLKLLTQVYLESHTSQEAAAHGIDVTVQLASK
jgi:UrcA family protein